MTLVQTWNPVIEESERSNVNRIVRDGEQITQGLRVAKVENIAGSKRSD